MDGVKAVLIGIAVIAISLAAALTIGKGLYDATHQSPTDIQWTKLDGKIRDSETWIGTCENNPWWIIPSKLGPDTVRVLEGNPDYGLQPRVHDVPGSFLSGCVKVQAVYINDEDYFVYKIWTR